MNRSLILLSVSAICLAQPATADPAFITNGADWKDTEGNPIVAHEGEISRFNGVFYWYGSSYANNPKGKFDIAVGPVWNGVQVYRSTDLIYLKESDTVMALCDQWWIRDKADINKSRFSSFRCSSIRKPAR